MKVLLRSPRLRQGEGSRGDRSCEITAAEGDSEEEEAMDVHPNDLAKSQQNGREYAASIQSCFAFDRNRYFLGRFPLILDNPYMF